MNEFHSWTTLIDEYKRHHEKDRQVRNASLTELFQSECHAILTYPFKQQLLRVKRLLRLTIEWGWIKAGRPYYNVHPLMVKKLCQTNLESIPASFIEVPHEFPTVCFRFNEPIPINYTENTGFIGVVDDAITKSDIYARSVLFAHYQTTPDDAREFLGPITPHLESICNLITFGARPQETIPGAISRSLNEVFSPTEKMVVSVMHTRLENLFRVIISAGFLANTPEENLVVPDILAKDRQAYQDALHNNDQGRIEQIVSRARRKGKLGWNVGTNEIFVEGREPSSRPGVDGERELHYSHIRSGHPHAVRYGEGKQKVKIKWFRPTRVRADLPFKVEE